MRTSLKEKLVIFAKGKWPHVVNGGEFERLALNEGFKSSNASRRLRELANEGKPERIMTGKSVSYRYRPTSDFVPARRPEFVQQRKLEVMKLL